MMTKSQAKSLADVLYMTRKNITLEYELIHSKFKSLLKTEGEFVPNDYELTYTGCDFPITCKVEKCCYDKDADEIICTLHDVDGDGTFEVSIKDLEPYTLYGDNILNLFGQAINCFTSKE